MAERNQTVTMKGKPLTLSGNNLNVGDPAPGFAAVRTDLAPVDSSSYRGKVCVISSVPSLDTPVCDKQTRHFDEEAGKLGPDIKVLTVSMDLPFAIKRWAEKAGVTNIEFLSDHRSASFGQAYGMLIKDLRLLARGVFVVDREGTVRYAQIVEDLSREPDYDAALNAARQLA